MAVDLSLIVNGRRFSGWKAIRVTRSMESLAGSFDLEVNDRWAAQDVPWPIAEEDRCILEIDGETVIAGYIDRRSYELDAKSRRLSFSGRDRAAVLVDASAVLSKWTFRSATVLQIARAVAQPFGVSVSLQPGLVLPKPLPKLVVSPGDTAWHVIEQAAQAAEVLAISDGAGGILLTRTGRTRAASLVEGENILRASVSYDGANRFYRYLVVTQTAGTDNAPGNATRVKAIAYDEGVRRQDRTLLVRSERGMTIDYARRRADWEARIRAARAETVSVTVRGWRQPGGALWAPNAKSHVESPSVGVNGVLLISQVDFGLDAEGKLATLRLVRPDAFDPEPQAIVRKSKGGLWKELAGGAR